MFKLGESRAYYRTAHWRELSRRCKERDGWTCGRCGFVADSPEDRRLMHAHHRVSRKAVPYATALDVPANIVTRCQRCHGLEHPTHSIDRPSRSAPPKMYRASVRRRRPRV